MFVWEEGTGLLLVQPASPPTPPTLTRRHQAELGPGEQIRVVAMHIIRPAYLHVVPLLPPQLLAHLEQGLPHSSAVVGLAVLPYVAL